MTDDMFMGVPIDHATAIVSIRPVIVPSTTERGEPLQVRVSAPAEGSDLPVVVFSHGYGWSMNGYDPLVEFWASHGFVVVQPTHLDSRTLALTPDDPRFNDIWRYRVSDVQAVIDHLSGIERDFPALSGRVDRTRIAVAGHSWGATSVSMLLGARVLDENGHPGENLTDARVRAGVLMALTGSGGDNLNDFAKQQFPFMHPDFDEMVGPALIVAGDKDLSPLATIGPEWFAQGYELSPANKSLLTLFDAQHSLGGISAYGAEETTDESPERVALLQRLTWAYLKEAFEPGDGRWSTLASALSDEIGALGTISSK